MAAHKATRDSAGAGQTQPAGVQPKERTPRRRPAAASVPTPPDQNSGGSSAAADLPSTAQPRRGADRIPFGKQKQRLAYPTRPGFVGHWFNDSNDRIERAIQAGWAFVNSRDGNPVSRPVGKMESGGGLRAYRMEIPKEIYDQDYRDQQQTVDGIMGPISQGKHGAKDGDNRYVPEHTPIKIEQGQRGL